MITISRRLRGRVDQGPCRLLEILRTLQWARFLYLCHAHDRLAVLLTLRRRFLLYLGDLPSLGCHPSRINGASTAVGGDDRALGDRAGCGR